MAQMGMFTRAETLGFKVGDVVAPPTMPTVEEAYRISRREAAPTSWFVLYIDPSMRSAERVERFVARKGFGTYCPRETTVREIAVRRNGLKSNAYVAPRENRVFVRPLLPRYMLVAMPTRETPFLKLDGAEARAHGVVGFVARDHMPVVIPDKDVAEILLRDQAGEWDATVKKGRKIVAKDPDWAREGKTVRIKDGPFAFFNAIIEKHLGRGDVRARVHLFGRETPVVFALDSLEGLAAV